MGNERDSYIARINSESPVPRTLFDEIVAAKILQEGGRMLSFSLFFFERSNYYRENAHKYVGIACNDWIFC